MSINYDIPGECIPPGHELEALRQDVARLLKQTHASQQLYSAGRMHQTRFLGAQPVSFCKSHIGDLLSKNFFACEKTDGIRGLLFATFDRSNRRYRTYLINRKNDFYLIPALLPLPQSESKAPYREFHCGTLIDGEIIEDVEYDAKGQVKRKIMKFLVFDCLTTCGQLLIDKPYRKRLGYFRQNVLEPLKRMKSERPDLMKRIPFIIEQKEMQLAYHIAQIFEQMPKLLHKSDGIIFTSSEDKYKIGTDLNILKWKPVEENTVDFGLQADQRSRTLKLFLWGGGKVYNYFSDLYEPDINTFEMLLATGDGKIAECSWVPDFPGNWKFMRYREDKDTANHVSVFENVMRSIQESVTREELLQITDQIRANWKERDFENIQDDSD